MNENKQNSIYRVEAAGALDSSFRRLIQNPRKILTPFIKEGMRVLDVGCGPGFFSIEIAKILNASGKVIAADVQQGMLDIIRKKINGTALEQTIELHKSDFENIGIVEKVDFILAFYMVHEVRNQEKFFSELTSILKPNGLMLVVEQKFEVSKANFRIMVDMIKSYGFTIVKSPKIFFSQTTAFVKK